MSCDFRIGQKVVCIEGGMLQANAIPDWQGDAPREGEIYTIRDMRPAIKSTYKGAPVIVLYFEEIRRGHDPWWGVELGYWHVCFRALQEGKDALSALRAILLDPSRKVSGEEGPVRKRVRERA